MGGHIWVESDGLEKGSTATFIVKLGICNNPVAPSRSNNVSEMAIVMNVTQSSDLMMG